MTTDITDKLISKNIELMGHFVPLVIEVFEKYQDEVLENANKKDIACVLGAYASLAHNLAVTAIENADLDAIDSLKMTETVKTMTKVIQMCTDELGLKNPLNEDEDDDDDENDDDCMPTDEDVDRFAKEVGLNKTETKVLKKIVAGRGDADLTAHEQEVAIKMKPKIDSFDF